MCICAFILAAHSTAPEKGYLTSSFAEFSNEAFAQSTLSPKSGDNTIKSTVKYDDLLKDLDPLDTYTSPDGTDVNLKAASSKESSAAEESKLTTSSYFIDVEKIRSPTEKFSFLIFDA
jgi:hypothetical protein